MLKNYFYQCALICITLILTGCGFHLQGEMKLAPPLHRLYVQSPDPYGYLSRNLIQNLKLSHVQIVSSPNLAQTVLVVLQDSTSQELLSVSSTQQTRQYNLKVTVAFEITDPQGTVLLPPTTLVENRTITIQSNQILGSSNEANLYFQQMRRSLAYAIIYRLASLEATHTLNDAFRTHTARSLR